MSLGRYNHCVASQRAYMEFASGKGPGPDGRAPCPCCGKLVKLMPKNGVVGARRTIIPTHKPTPIGLAAMINVDTRLRAEAAEEALAVLQWLIPEPGQFRQPTDDIYARALAAIAKATGSAA